MLAVIVVGAVIAHRIGGNRAMLLTGIFAVIGLGVLVLAFAVFDSLRRGLKKPDE